MQDDESTRIFGAGLTSVTIKLWGYVIFSVLMVVSVFKAIKYFNDKKTKQVVISLATIPGYLLTLFVVMTVLQFAFAGYLLTLFVVMTVLQFAFVKPNELDKEKKYIEANINNTRTAYNINIKEHELDSSDYNNLEVVNKNPETVNNTAIVSKDITLDTLSDNQTSSDYYSYSNSQIGKYNINGKDELVYLSPRQIESKNNTSYNNKTYEYTHGYGTVVTSANKTNETGNMQYIQKSFDGSDNQINVTQPRIYFGLDENRPIVTNSKDKLEFDYPKSETETAQNTYDGKAGLKTNFLDRLVLGIREKNLNISFSSSVTKDSKILLNRNVLERVKKVFPYIIYDEKPYQVITEEGKIVWVIDGYTTASKYPYSQMSVIERNGTRERLNYIRNSVKVIVDSYDGTVNFYITDTTDPIIMAYKEIYPELFKNKEEIPQEISNHFVYPEFLYNIQANMLEKYHNVKADVLYRSSDIWDRATHTTGQTLKTKGTPIDPYYTMIKTVDNEKEGLGLVLPYTLYERQSLISYLVGTYDENGNSKLTLYKYSVDSNIIGPMQLDTQIEQDEEISSTLQNLNVTGTKLIRNMIMVPIDNTILYVEPIYQVMLKQEISNHFVYPEFLYNIQANMLEKYHNVKADVLYRSSDIWDRATHTTGQTLKTKGTPIDPYYTMIKTVDNEKEGLGLVLPYTLYERQSLISYLVGTYDENGNSKLTLYKYSVDSNIIGPMQLDTQIEQDEEISSTLQNLNVTGTKLIRNMIMVPIDNTILYVEPIYQVMLNESEVPALKKVIVAIGNKVAIGNNLKEAMRNLGSQSAINIEVSNTDDINSIIDEIIKANKNVENSTKNSDWEMVGKDMSSLQSLIDRLEEVITEQRKQEKLEEETNKANNITEDSNEINIKNMNVTE